MLSASGWSDEMGRLIGAMVFFTVAALMLPSAMMRNSQTNVQKSEQGEGKRNANSESSKKITKASLSSEERIDADRQGHFVSQFRMNGKPVEALVDTGATIVAISKSTARRLGISVTPADFIYQVQTANGTTKVARAVIKTIEFGGIRVHDVEAAVIDDKSLGGTLLGMSFLNQLKSFKVEDGELILKQ
jgi:aspartyl protease family protein